MLALAATVLPSARAAHASTQTIAADTDPVVAAAGDIACDPASTFYFGGDGDATHCRMKATSDLLVGLNPTGVLALGDDAYECGGPQAFEQSYDPSWGRLKSITYPVIGNHEYQTTANTPGGTDCSAQPDAAGYFGYYGAVAGDPTKGYYSFDIGAWHLIALNAQCDFVACSAGSAQELWLKLDLAAHTTSNILAFWHQPRWSSGLSGNNSAYDAFWQDLYVAHADIVLDGHDHIYERFALQNPSEQADPNGIREFTVGTGGKSHSSVAVVQPNSEIRDADTYGILKLTLRANSYSWQFVPISGATFTDSGFQKTHRAPPNQAPAVDSVAIDQSSPQTKDTLTSTVTGHDLDGDPVTYSYQWFKNGVALSGRTGTSLDLSVAGNGDRGDQISLQVTANDGTVDGTPATSSPVTVADTPPTATVTLSSGSPGTDDTLTATAATGDTDGDPVSLTYLWKVNGVAEQTTTTTSTTDTFDLSAPGHGDAGDTVTVDVTPSDGTLSGTPASASATVGPTGVNLSLSAAASPNPVNTGDDLTYTMNVANQGNGSASGVTLSESLPSGTVFESASPAQGTCSASGQTVTCNLGSLVGGGSVGVAITIAPTAGGSTYRASATVSSSGGEATLADNAASVQSIVTGGACTIVGTPGNDATLTGTSGNDTICGIGGDDTIHGGAGNDFIVGGAGNDSIFGDDGTDNVVPGLGTDSVDGGAGSDQINYIDIMSSYGVSGVNVDLSANSVTGGAGSDTLVAGTVENATGSPQDDTLTGDGGPNTLLGGAGNDTLSGGAGNDFLGGSAGSDSSTGGDGNDILAPGTGDDPLGDGGPGTDTVSYIYETIAAGVSVDLAAGTVTGGAGSDSIINVESATGSQLNDTLTGNSGNNILLAGNGDDTLTGGDGNDFMTGGPGVDSLLGGNGDDGLAPGPGDETVIDGGAGVDNLTYFDATSAVTINLATGSETGGGGNDTITGFEKATGSPFNDSITADGGANTLLGGNGDDTLLGAGGDDFLLASLGNDTLSGGDGNDRLAPGLGNDLVVDGGTGIDLVTYLLDTVASGITVDLGAGTVTGGAGTDTLTSVEQVTGTNLNDTLTGSTAANQLFGVGGNDQLSGLDGNDYLAGGASNDAHDGGTGTDVCQDSSGINTFTSCESTPAIAERIVTPTAQTAADAEISYELSVGRWVAQQEALQRAAFDLER